MKKGYLVLVVFLFCIVFLAHGQSSKDEYSGNWEDGDTWSPEVAPGTEGLVANVGINGFVTRNGNLSFGQNGGLALGSGDTLVIMGNLKFNYGVNLNIPSDAVIVVGGDLEGREHTNISANGKIVVIGNFYPGPNSQINVNGSGATYVFKDTNIANLPNSADRIEGKEDLIANDTPLKEFIDMLFPGVLPVNLLYFKAQAQPQAVEIDWASSKAWDFSHYELERSGDGRNFHPIALIDAEENSDWVVNYSFADKDPLNGTSYYRLKAVDIDGSFEYKGIEVVQFTTLASLKAYPNPVSGGKLHIQHQMEGEVKVSLTDNSGRIAYSASLEPGANTLDTSSLQPGYYVLVVEGDYSMQKTQVIIQ